MNWLSRRGRETLVHGVLGLVGVLVFAFSHAASAAGSTACWLNGDTNVYECGLAIDHPASIVAGQAFDVRVIVTDGGWEGWSPLGGNDSCAAGVRVRLDILPQEGPGIASYVASASNGVANFHVAGLAADSYVMAATATQASGKCIYSDDWAYPDVQWVAPGQPVAPCPLDSSCVQTTNNGAGGGSAATLITSFPSYFHDVAFVGYDNTKDCGMAPVDVHDGVLSFLFDANGGTGPKTIIFGLKPSLVNQGIGKFAVCWETTAGSFATRDGSPPAWQNSDGFWVGLLPACSPKGTLPCVQSATSTQHNGAFITVVAPGGTVDPKAYPGTP